jgi:hypothetical protein
MKTAIALIVVFVALAVAVSQPTGGARSEVGRYQLRPATTSDGPTVFRFDTATGEAWQYQPSSTSKDANGKDEANPAIFIPVRSAPQSIFPQP